jgi:hypothetical protein
MDPRTPADREIDGLVPGRDDNFMAVRIKASDYSPGFELDLGGGEKISIEEVVEMSDRLADAAGRS